MSTKHSNDGSVHSHNSPYDSPYTAFTNYMNVLSDFRTRVKEQVPSGVENEELNSLILTIRNQENEIEQLHREVDMLRNNIVKDTTGDFIPNEEAEKPVEKKVVKAKKATKAKPTKATEKKAAKPVKTEKKVAKPKKAAEKPAEKKPAAKKTVAKKAVKK